VKSVKSTSATWDTEEAARLAREAYCYVARTYPLERRGAQRRAAA
jgi:hypothetical protein